MTTLDDVGRMAVKLMIRSRRKTAEALEQRAINASDEHRLFAPSKASLLADAAIARWEADMLERDGKLPAEYLELLP